MRGGEWCCGTALVRDGVPCGLSPMALFMCREWHWGRRNEGVQRGFEQQQLVDVCGSPEYACAAPHERAVDAAAFVLRGSGSLLSWGVGAKPSVFIRSRALHVTGVGVFVEYLLPTRPLLRLASAVVGAEDFGLGDVPQRCWCPRAGAARTMCQASARGRATHALPEHVFVCIVPAPHLRCGRGGGGFRTEGMRPATSRTPCVCEPLVPCTVCLSSRHFGIAQIPPPPPAPPPPKRCRVHRSVLWHHKTLTDLRVRFPPESRSPPLARSDRSQGTSVRQCTDPVSFAFLSPCFPQCLDVGTSAQC